MKNLYLCFIFVLSFLGCSSTLPNASFWLLDSIPEDFIVQPTPIAIGRNNIIKNTLSVNLVEPQNYENRGWWTFSNNYWNGNGDYFLLYVPMELNQDGRGFNWLFDEAKIFSEDGYSPTKVKIESNKIRFSLNSFITIFQIINPSVNSITRKSNDGFFITFTENERWDKQQIPSMLRPNEPGGLANRAAFMGIDYDLAKKIHGAKSYTEIKDDLDNLVTSRYQTVGDDLRKSIYDFSASWDLCINEFSEIIIELTQHNWFYSNYICVVSAFHYGLSNWYGNVVARFYNADPIEQRYVTAYEIVLSHIFHISRKYFNKNDVEDHIIWAISEITAALILNDGRLLELWGSNYVPRVESLTGYPSLFDLENKLMTVYKNRLNFMDYLNSAVQLAKQQDKNFLVPN